MKVILNSPLFKLLMNIIKFLLFSILVVFVLVIVVQRFSNNNLSVGGYRVFSVVSNSMEPKYVVGDVLVVKSVPLDTIKKGDDLCYYGTKEDFAGKIVTHEVRRTEKIEGRLKFHTKGLMNVIDDPLVDQDQVYGIVIYKTKLISFLSKLANNKYSFFIFIFIPLLIIILIEVKNIMSEAFDKLELETEQVYFEEKRRKRR